MLKSLIKILGIIAGLLWAGMACAVGLGGANASSALGQPFKAEISLVAVGDADKSSLTARMATPDAFKAAGLDYPYHLSKLKFEIDTRRNGELYIKVTSKEAVNDPFVSLLVELSWSSGRLMREYTFLLDPPDYKAEQPSPEEVKPIEPTIAAAPPAEEPPVVVAPVVAPTPAVTPSTPKTTAPSPAPTVTTKAPSPAAEEEAATEAPEAEATAEAAGTPAAEGAATGEDDEDQIISVERGDTLGKIAKLVNDEVVKDPSISLERMLVALYRANADKFDGKNMNRLRAGKILVLPFQEDLDGLTQAAAVKEIRIQTANWNAYRQKLAAATAAAPEQAPKQEASGKISTSVADKTPAAKETAKEVLKLSKGEAPGDKMVAGGKAQTAQEDKAQAKEEAIAKEKAAKESSARAAMLEKNVQDMKKLVELKGAPVTASAVAPASAVAAASAVQPAKPVAKPKVAPVIQPEPSLMDDLLDNPIYLGGGAAILIGLGGLGFYLVRRRSSKGGEKKKPDQQAAAKKKVSEKKADSEEAQSVASVPSPVPTPAASSAAQAPAAAAKPVAKPAEAEEVDPISEADLFLNFGRDAQAEEVLKEALNKNPANIPVQLKLLSIYVNRKDANAFSTIARQIKESGNEDAWKQAAALGRAVDPSNPEYGGAGNETAAATDALSESGKQGAMPTVDMDIGFNVPMDLDVTAAVPAVESASAQVMDFDVSGHTASAMDFDVTGSQPGLTAAQHTDFDVTGSHPNVTTQAMDLDVTGSHPNVTATTIMDFDVTGSHPNLTATTVMDFDVTGSHPGVVESVAPENSTVVLNAPMDFDISASSPAASAVKEETSSVLDLGSMDFDISAPSPAASAAKEETPSVLEIGNMDFDISSSMPNQGSTTESAMDMDLGGINLNLDGATTLVSPVAEAKKDERWQEVATKLDLARAYQEMGDGDGAKEILGEVLRDGDEQQRAAAQTLMQQL